MDPQILEIDANMQAQEIDVTFDKSVSMININDANYLLWYTYLQKPLSYLYLSGKIKHLIIPEGPINVFCEKMDIENVDVSKTVTRLVCYENNISSLYLHDKIEYVDARDNDLQSVQFDKYPEKLEALHLLNNPFVKLEIDKVPSDCIITFSPSAYIPESIMMHIMTQSQLPFVFNIQADSESNI